MAVKFEAIIFTDGKGELSAAVTISGNKTGHTQQEFDVAKHLDRYICDMFKNEFNAQVTVVPLEEGNANVH